MWRHVHMKMLRALHFMNETFTSFYLWPALWQQQPAQAPWRLPSTLSSFSAHPLCQQETQAANQRAAGHMRSASTNARVGSVAVGDGDGDRVGVGVGVSAWQHLSFEYEF